MSTSPTSKSVYNNTNGVPRTDDGAVVHLGVKKGEVANRVISVGAASRARKIADKFDDQKKVLTISSARGFTVYTGTFSGIPVSVVATGMGIANMDFVVRELRAVVEGPMAIVRFGTCGGIQDISAVGSISVCKKGAVFVRRNPDGFHEGSHEPKYQISKPVKGNPELATSIMTEFKKVLVDRSNPVVDMMNATCCSFYSSQGRLDNAFDDYNTEILNEIRQTQPDVGTMEMETFHLLDVARCSKGTISAAAAVIIIANRKSGKIIEEDEQSILEESGATAILRAITAFKLN